jgi:hypothetical protein
MVGISSSSTETLEDIQEQLFANAKAKSKEREKEADNWKDFMIHLNNRNVVLTPW